MFCKGAIQSNWADLTIAAGQLFLSWSLKTRNHGYNYLHAVKTEVRNFNLVVFTAFQQQKKEKT